MTLDTLQHGKVDPFARLVLTVQQLSLARDFDAIVEIVRHEARYLTGADGATFVLKDNDMCYYVNEDAIAPLWKGKRFKMSECVSGWVMLNRQSLVIEDIYKDDRVPIDAYRPTFVKSILMVPIRTQSPIGAIGNYWASYHNPTDDEIKLLQALADSTSVAIENVQLYADLKKRLKESQDLSSKLQSSLSEKEVLLKEINHRVKNNLQIMASLLNLHSERINDAAAKSILLDSINRISAMSVVHEMLYQSDNMEKINIDEYIDNLVDHICKITKTDATKIKLATDVDSISLKLDQAIPCGLIVNELLSNVFKHAYPGDKNGNVLISIKTRDGKISISVSDDGVGISDDGYSNTKCLGLNLVKRLTGQLSGTMQIKSDKGTIVEVNIPFPIDN